MHTFRNIAAFLARAADNRPTSCENRADIRLLLLLHNFLTWCQSSVSKALLPANFPLLAASESVLRELCEHDWLGSLSGYVEVPTVLEQFSLIKQ